VKVKQDQTSHSDINMNINKIFDIQFFNESKKTLIYQYIKKYIKNGKGKNTVKIFTPNPEQVVLARHNERFLTALQTADISLPDGNGVVLASRVLHLFGKAQPLHERITGIDVMREVIDLTDDRQCVVIGGFDQGDLLEVREVQVGQKTVLWLPGYRDVQHPTEQEEESVQHLLRSRKPVVVFVALGAPYQEYWVIQHQELLNSLGVKIAMVVGGSLDVLRGKLQRAPLWVQRVGLEWMYRLIQEPWRWKRQLKLMSFIGFTFKELFK
jgi:N-acetylglucosaminyldiphosphoundecaprenol N-acetyl-beta-D-mannosaminyltransferase